VAALLNAYHDVQRLGIDFVASPRHADLLLVTGVMTRNLEEAARRTFEAMPEPRLVVAVGACAIGGGVFAGSPQSRDGAASTLPVDVFVPGCPPRPEAIIEGLLMAIDLRR
jgi:Ni,Fe-hydrogenase III small subunit